LTIHLRKTWGSDRRFHNGASLWESLLGISNISLQIWSIGYIGLIAPVKHQLIKWFQKQIANSDEIDRLCRLLITPCCDLFINPGLLLVSVHLKFQNSLDEQDAPKGFVRVPFKYYDNVAKMCAHLWENRRPAITSDDHLYSAFKEIVIHLVAIQNPTGVELQDRLISFN
jgi:hypothetical protein